MDQPDLFKFQKLYGSEALGAAKILRETFGLPPDFVIPLTLSHGVDFDCDKRAADVDCCEPIYWSTNQSLHDRATKVKPSIILPHPWVLMKYNRGIKEPKKKVLVIGPPPGEENDLNLYDAMRQLDIGDYDILIKQRGNVERTLNYWRNVGIGCVSAGGPDSGFYERLYGTITNYSTVIGCTLSSAMIFAAAIGKECIFLPEYSVHFYDVANWKDIFWFSDRGKMFVAAVLNQDKHIYTAIAEEILGGQEILNADKLKGELITKIKDVSYPLHHASGSKGMLRSLATHYCLMTGTVELLRNSPVKYLVKKLTLQDKKILSIRINEIDAWLNGLNETNFQSEHVLADKRLGRWPGYGY